MLDIRTDDPELVVIGVSGKLTKPDYDQFVPEFESVAKERGAMRVLILLEDFRGWDVAGLWEDLKFDITHQKDMGRVAVVGDRDWQKWGTVLSKPFFRAEIRYFEPAQADEARAWLKVP